MRITNLEVYQGHTPIDHLHAPLAAALKPLVGTVYPTSTKGRRAVEKAIKAHLLTIPAHLRHHRPRVGMTWWTGPRIFLANL